MEVYRLREFWISESVAAIRNERIMNTSNSRVAIRFHTRMTTSEAGNLFPFTLRKTFT